VDRVRVAVVGGGPAGYVTARRLGQLGVECVLVERAHLGGTCLNWGCIPTKALYSATHVLARRETYARMGLSVEARVDLARLRAWVGEVVAQLRSGIEKLLVASKVEVVHGQASLSGPGKLRIRGGQGERELAAQAIVLATGSAAVELRGLPFEGERVWSSDHALMLKKVPERLVVVGGGVIGLEMATIYRRLGSQVTVVEMMDTLLPGVGVSRRGEMFLRQALKKQGIEIRLSCQAEGLGRETLVVRTQSGTEEIPAEVVLVAVGRKPQLQGLGLEMVGIAADKGFVATDERFQAAPGIYAIGDLRGGWLLAHKASHEGLVLADHLAGREVSQHKFFVPQAIFTQPEVALVGKTEGPGLKVGRFAFGALGRAWAEGEPEGYAQIAADESGRVVGAEIIGPHASDLIAEAALAVEKNLTLEEFAAAVHAHPTFPEALWEAVLAALGRPLHTA